MSPSVPPTLIVIDTDVFSRVMVRSNGAQDLRDQLVGKVPVIATQTRAELLAWPRLRGWGAARTEQLNGLIESTAVIPVTDEVVGAYVDLGVACIEQGHPLAQKIHSSDRWVAATAIALARPLISLDGIYRNAPGLMLS